MRLTNYLLAALLIFSVNIFAQTDSNKDKKKKVKENKNYLVGRRKNLNGLQHQQRPTA